MSSYPPTDPSGDLAVLTQLLVDHQMRKSGNCSCGYQYALGESIRAHRAQKIIESGFHRAAEHERRLP